MITFSQFNLSDYKDSLIVTDDKIAKLYNISGSNVYLLPQGETAKSFVCVENLCKWFLRNNLRRDGRVTAVGGGSIGDTVGFACSIYKRGGAKLTHVPTTLLAQIDSSIGGKTAIDLDGVKNAVGSFYRADTVIDIGFLKTLDEVQLNSGMGELFKYRMLSHNVDNAYDGEITEKVIKECVSYKQEICEIDLLDGNIRKTLNFGHTLGHAMELFYDVPHGIAVANGLYYETLLACKLGKCNDGYCEYWTTQITDFFGILPLCSDIFRLAVFDKKNNADGICFMLPSDFKENYISLNRVVELLCCD